MAVAKEGRRVGSWERQAKLDVPLKPMLDLCLQVLGVQSHNLG